MAVLRAKQLWAARFANLEEREYGTLYVVPAGKRAIIRHLTWSLDNPLVAPPPDPLIWFYLTKPGGSPLAFYGRYLRYVDELGAHWTWHHEWDLMVVLSAGDLVSFGTAPGFGNPVTTTGHGHELDVLTQ